MTRDRELARRGRAPAGRRRSRGRPPLIALALAVTLVACAQGRGETDTPPEATPAAPTAVPAITPAPTEVSGPPVATLAGAGDAPLPGELGSFAWDGLASDSGWIVPAAPGGTSPGAGLEVAFDPGAVPRTWAATWAPIRNGVVDTPAGGGHGAGTPVAIAVPTTVGSWSLRVTAVFGEGRRGTWYWRLELGS